MAKKNKAEDAPAGSPAWMATFSDLMTQILVFFIFLFTMSSIDVKKAREALISFNTAFGGITDQSMQMILSTYYVVPYPETTSDPMVGASGSDLSQMQLEEAMHDIIFYVKKNALEEDVDVFMSKSGNIEIHLKDHVLFDLGKADIKPTGKKIMKKMGSILSKMKNEFRIEGHTDNVPIVGGPYKSNWELSSARAISVMKYLVQTAKIDPKKLAIAGYGEFRPIKPNNTAANRAKNRRVVIVIVKKGDDTL